MESLPVEHGLAIQTWTSNLTTSGHVTSWRSRFAVIIIMFVFIVFVFVGIIIIIIIIIIMSSLPLWSTSSLSSTISSSSSWLSLIIVTIYNHHHHHSNHNKYLLVQVSFSPAVFNYCWLIIRLLCHCLLAWISFKNGCNISDGRILSGNKSIWTCKYIHVCM